MADFYIDYDEIKKAKQEMDAYADEYREAAVILLNSIEYFSRNWKGETKETFMNYINTSVSDYILNSVPALIESLSEILNQNAEQIMNMDKQIATAVPKPD